MKSNSENDFWTDLKTKNFILLLDKFYLKAADSWFKFIEWLIIIGALIYIYKQKGDFFVFLLLLISKIILYRYIVAFLYAFRWSYFLPGFFKTSRKIVFILNLIIGIIIFTLANKLVYTTVYQFELLQ